MEIKKVGIVGLGTMGSGIAQVVAQSGYHVYVTDIVPMMIEKAWGNIRKSLSKMVEKGQLSENDQAQALERLIIKPEISGIEGCDLVIEAVTEDVHEKQKVFEVLNKGCLDTTIFASNTSTLSITELAACAKHRERFIGLHFFNPPTVMKLVEVIKTFVIDDDVLRTSVEFVKSIGKVPVIAKDRAGFIVNYFLAPYLYDAMRAVSEGVASVKDIDDAMVLGCGHPMGPLKLADLIGLDLLAMGGAVLFNEYKDKRYSPPPILNKLVALGFLGAKSGRGFYDWSDSTQPVPVDFD